MGLGWDGVPERLRDRGANLLMPHGIRDAEGSGNTRPLNGYPGEPDGFSRITLVPLDHSLCLIGMMVGLTACMGLEALMPKLEHVADSVWPMR